MSKAKAKPAPIDFDRTLPHNLEAERAVLGAVLLHNEVMDRVQMLDPPHFYRNAHERIFGAMRRLYDRKVPIDLTTLKEELARVGDLDEVGGPAYISALVDGVPHATHARHYGDIVSERAKLRALIFMGNRMVNDAYNGEETAEEIISAADASLITLMRDGGLSATKSMQGSGARLLDVLEHRIAHKGEVTGVPSGFPTIDGYTLGWQGGDLIVTAARPSMGKTTFAMNCVQHCCESVRPDVVGDALSGRPRRAVVFSLEMTRAQLELRMLSSLSGVPASRILGGYIYDADWAALSNAIGRMAEWDLHIDDSSRRTPRDIRAECRRLKGEVGHLDLIVIDYAQLLSPSIIKRGDNRTAEMTQISWDLKQLAKELLAPVNLLSQLKRTGGSRPTLEDLRDSGSLEQDADLVGFLHRKTSREDGLTYYLLDKARNGPTGSFKLSFDKNTLTFTDDPDAADEAPPPEAGEKTDEQKHAEKVKAIIRNRKRKSS